MSSENPLTTLENATYALSIAKDLNEVGRIRNMAEAARHYARAAKLGIEAQNHAAEVKIRAERRAGELLKELERGATPRNAGGEFTVSDMLSDTVSEYRATIDDAEVNERQARRWQQMSEIPTDVFEEHIEETKAEGKELTSASVQRILDNRKNGTPHVSLNSGDNEWYTPKEYIDAARKVLGTIDLDPASSEEANKVVRAARFFTILDDGLTQDWHGRVWMNPPYSSDKITKFSEKLVASVVLGHVTDAITLVNNATETRWFNHMVSIATAVCFPTSRVKFWKPDGDHGAPLQGQAIIYIGSSKQLFAESFSHIGWIAEVKNEF